MIFDDESFEAAVEEALAALETATADWVPAIDFEFDPPTAADLEALGRALCE